MGTAGERRAAASSVNTRLGVHLRTEISSELCSRAAYCVEASWRCLQLRGTRGPVEQIRVIRPARAQDAPETGGLTRGMWTD